MTDETVAVEQCDRQAAADLVAITVGGVEHIPDYDPHIQAFARHRIAALAAAPARERGQPCQNCLKPIEVGQVVLPWDAAGEMHADCDRPYRTDHVQQPGCPAPCVLIGQPMRQVPLAALASVRKPIAGDATAPLPFDRDTLGRFVRDAWVRWAHTQPTPKPSWLVTYDGLSEPDKEADRQIGEAVARWVIIGQAAALAHPRPTVDREAVAAIINPKAFKSLEATVAEWKAWMDAEHPNNPKLSAQIPPIAQEEYDRQEVARLRALKKADAILALATPPAAPDREESAIRNGLFRQSVMDLREHLARCGRTYAYPVQMLDAVIADAEARATPPASLPGESTNP